MREEEATDTDRRQLVPIDCLPVADLLAIAPSQVALEVLHDGTGSIRRLRPGQVDVVALALSRQGGDGGQLRLLDVDVDFRRCVVAGIIILAGGLYGSIDLTLACILHLRSEVEVVGL